VGGAGDADLLSGEAGQEDTMSAEPIPPLAEPPVVIPDTEHDRYATFGFISWWDQRKVRDATVLVAGAGALGNEVVKNLALLGVGRLLIVDFDTVEAANLSRSVLFRDTDRGRGKAESAAAAAMQLNPDVAAGWIDGDLTRQVGLGLFRRADVVVSCVDSREARLAINRACYRVGRPWVDGALHEMLGEVRVFWPGRGACYECTLGPADYQAIGLRASCSALARERMLEGKLATTTTIAAIIGGAQAQEVLKILHGLPVQPGAGVVWNGLTNDVHNVTYPRAEDCPSHDAWGPIVECPELSAHASTARQMLAHVRRELGGAATLELGYDLVAGFECVAGHAGQEPPRPAAAVGESAAACPVCGRARWPRLIHRLGGGEACLDHTLADLGVPPLHVLAGCGEGGRRWFELTGDAGAAPAFTREPRGGH
jgi:molybdopterin/thiamine biosynthesis adenylyltransferase